MLPSLSFLCNLSQYQELIPILKLLNFKSPELVGVGVSDLFDFQFSTLEILNFIQSK